jgi:ADP-ribose pyrophosphatase YjhB (NUDIX family)
MSNAIDFGVTVRGLIVDQGELFMVKHDPSAIYHALPGGHLEPGETLTDGLIRELIEETDVQPEIGHLLFVNDWVSTTHHRVEFFFWIRNGHDYRRTDTTSASHGFEIASFAFGNAADPKFGLRPPFLQKKFPRIVELGEAYPTELIRSY